MKIIKKIFYFLFDLTPFGPTLDFTTKIILGVMWISIIVMILILLRQIIYKWIRLSDSALPNSFTTEFVKSNKIGENLFYSSNEGSSWVQKVHSGTYLFGINSFNSSNKNPNYVAMGGLDVYKSTNGGSSWGLVNNWYQYYNDMYNYLHADIPEIRWFVDPENNQEFALISTDGGLYWANSQLSNVNNLSMNGLGVSQYYSTYTMQTNPH